MSCRSTNAGSAFIAFARWENNRLLSDPACLSTFHELRRSYRSLRDNEKPHYSRDDYLTLISDMRQRVEQRPSLSPKRRESLLERLRQAERDSTPDPEMIFALQEIRERIAQRSDRLEFFLQDMARRSRTQFSEVLERFKALESQAPRERTHRSSTEFSPTEQQILDQYGLGREQGTAHAAVRLMKETEEIEITLFRRRQQRIVQTTYSSPIHAEGTNISFLGAGYDSRNGRLEIEVEQDGAKRTLAYRRVPEEYWDVLNPENGSPESQIISCWRTHIRAAERHAYPTPYAALHDGVAPRCTECGQFADTTHACPVQIAPRDLHTWTTRSRWSNQEITTTQLVNVATAGEVEIPETAEVTATISLPAIRELRSVVAEGPARICDISYRHSQLYPSRDSFSIRTFSTSGNVVIWHDENGTNINTSELRCQCPEYLDNYACQHIRDIEQAIQDRLGGEQALSRRQTDDERLRLMQRAQERAERAREQDWTTNPEAYREAARTWRRDAQTIYSEDFAAFREALTSAQNRSREAGRPQIPFYPENALDGAAARGSGKAFGVEIEYEFPSGWSSQERQDANARIARRLHAEGITWSDRQQPYQASKARGFRDRQREPDGVGNWTLEKDGSVNGGELVSPGLYDESETWTNLARALEILTSEGAIPTKKAGLHVHVGTSDFNGDPAVYTELTRLINQHEDVIYRLSADPVRGTHRRGRFARPIPDVPPEGFTDAAELSRWQGMGKYWAANFNAVRGGPNDHPEFRVYDSSLDAGTIQAQIKVSIALTEAAKRHAHTTPTLRAREPIGSHAARRAGRRTRRALSDEELASETATTRSFLDTLFRRDEDKEHLVAIFAHTKWAR